MKKSKILILLITLTFPVILYLFLRSYGQNEFDLPVFFQNEEKLYCDDAELTEGSFKVYLLKQQDSLKLEDAYIADYKVIHFPNTQDPEIQTLKNELNRALNTFNDLSLNLLSFKTVESSQDSISDNNCFLKSDRAKTYLYSAEEKEALLNCIYAFPTKQWDGNHPSEEIIPIAKTLVLLDNENRIRGYYNGYETKEVDRLILEIRVLLSNK
ncbi:MAG: hypothetical protein ACQETL_13810 [Bacteroidota bacterium]